MSEQDLYNARLANLRNYESKGHTAYPVRCDRTHTAAELGDLYRELPPGEAAGVVVSVAGRLMSHRSQGKVAFGDLVDQSGSIQLFVPTELVETFEMFDQGDWVGATGEVVRTKRGELSIRPTELRLLSKALRPMPDKWHGVADTETRYRRRYLDLIANPEARQLAEARSRIIRATRQFFDDRGFLEVETPLLHPIPGGAAARPFKTHYNALGSDFYLRIAKELYLKRLVIGGVERVYEIGRVFRNEGVSTKYNPEFTMLESYEAYADYFDVMDMVEELVRFVAQEALDASTVTVRDEVFDLTQPWRRVTVLDAVKKAVGQDIDLDTPLETLKEICSRNNIETKSWWTSGHLIEALRDELVEPTLIGPTILYDYPVEVSPLARNHRDDPRLVERFEFYLDGREIGNAFSELNDPIEQRARFESQVEARNRGDEEANPLDEDFLTALDYGMPPCGGLGVGVDRLVMALTSTTSIREVILFPTLKPKEDPHDEGSR